MPAVSVLMPCYNAEGTLDEALKSLEWQTFHDFEVVAVDDGSGDQTLGILNEWAGRDARFRVISIPHGGICAALNTGLEACRAGIIARMDADDRSHPRRLALQTAFLEEHKELAVVGCRVAGFPEDQVRAGFRLYIDWLNSLISDAGIRREIFVESPIPHPSAVFHKAWLVKVGGYQDRGWPEDYDLWLRLYLAGARFGKTPEVLLDWREYPGRLTRSDSRYSLENFLRAKAHYLRRGPAAGRDAVIVWGAGMMGRRLSKHLAREGCPLAAFVDIDPKKIGRTRRGLPVIAPGDLPGWWRRFSNPLLLAAVGARGARALIRERLERLGLREGQDWWSAA